jgi:hypothetical protein
MENPYTDVLEQLFQVFFNQKEILPFDQRNYLLEAGAEKFIGYPCESEIDSKKFLSIFFYTNVDRMNMSLHGNVLSFPCKVRYRGKHENDSAAQVDIEKVEVTSDISPTLYNTYLIRKK